MYTIAYFCKVRAVSKRGLHGRSGRDQGAAIGAEAATASGRDQRGVAQPLARPFVYETLRDAIWDGHFAVGDRMTEEEIAQMLGVSRTPVREALQRLQERGLLAVGAGARWSSRA